MEKKASGAVGPALTKELDLSEYSRSFAALYDQLSGPNSATGVERCYGFKVAGWQFLVEQGWLAEYVANPVATPLPNAPAICLGMVNIRGNIVPLYNIATLLPTSSLSIPEPSSPQGLLLTKGKDNVMLVIDGKPVGLERQQLHETAPLLAQTSITWLQTALAGPDGVWHQVDLERLFSALVAMESEADQPLASLPIE